jgi:hypothetical protein
MPWPLALALAIWGTELVVIVLVVVLAALGDPWGLLPPERAWTEEDEAEWQELLRQQGREPPPDAKGEWR